MDKSEVFLLKLDAVAAGTRLRVGRGVGDFRPVEDLSLGDEIYDPLEDRFVEITEVACVTLEAETLLDRGFSPKKVGDDLVGNTMVYAVKVPRTLMRKGYVPPIRGEYVLDQGMVFFALGFERRAIVETTARYCEFMRPSNYAIENFAPRAPQAGRDDTLTWAGQ